MPFSTRLGQRHGSGQDNAVFRMVEDHEKPHLRKPTGKVLKINHKTAKEHRPRHSDEREAAWRGTLYKKNKYEILKRFLGDFVPESSFVLGEVQEGAQKRPAEYTVQAEVPRVSLNQLSEEQRHDPRLKEQLVGLMSRLRFMYEVLGEANARTPDGVSLDGTVDLGGVSSYVRAERFDRMFTESDAQVVIDENASPNLLVDPESMRLYCIDFDQGQWTDGMTEAKTLAFEIAKQREAQQAALGGLATAQVHQPEQLSFPQ